MGADRQTWLAERRTGIGGSDVAPILGLSPWRTPLDVYMDKRGEAPELEDSDPMLWGRLLEPVIRQRYADVTGLAVQTPPMFRSATHPFMIANVDGIAGGRRILECKTARTGAGWGEEGTDEVPDHYALQAQHYMLVAGCAEADFAVLIGGSDFRVYHLDADPDLHALLVERESEFWACVEAGTPPEPVTYSDAVARYGRSAAAGEVQASGEAIDAHTRLLALRAARKTLDEQEEEAKAVIFKALGDTGDTLVLDGRAIATWRLAKAARRLDTKALAVDHPDIFEQYSRIGDPSRRLLIK